MKNPTADGLSGVEPQPRRSTLGPRSQVVSGVAAGVSPAVEPGILPGGTTSCILQIVAFPLSWPVWPRATEQRWPRVVWIAFTPQPVVVRHQPEGACVNGQPFHHAYKRETAAIYVFRSKLHHAEVVLCQDPV